MHGHQVPAAAAAAVANPAVPPPPPAPIGVAKAKADKMEKKLAANDGTQPKVPGVSTEDTNIPPTKDPMLKKTIAPVCIYGIPFAGMPQIAVDVAGQA